MSALFFLLVLGGAVYFTPTIIAVARHKMNAGAIFALNLFLGWTLVGWVVSIVWALTVDQDRIVLARPFDPRLGP